MADTGIFCTTAEVQARVGANASSTYNAETYINMYVAQAESYINTVCKYNFSDAYSSLNADVKKILTRWAASLAAMDVISADTTGYLTKIEPQIKLDILNDIARQCEKELVNKDKQDYIVRA